MTRVHGMKNVIMQVTYLLNGSMVNLLFYRNINIPRESDSLRETSPQSYPGSPNCLENLIVSMLLMGVSKC